MDWAQRIATQANMKATRAYMNTNPNTDVVAEPRFGTVATRGSLDELQVFKEASVARRDDRPYNTPIGGAGAYSGVSTDIAGTRNPAYRT